MNPVMSYHSLHHKAVEQKVRKPKATSGACLGQPVRESSCGLSWRRKAYFRVTAPVPKGTFFLIYFTPEETLSFISKERQALSILPGDANLGQV